MASHALISTIAVGALALGWAGDARAQSRPNENATGEPNAASASGTNANTGPNESSSAGTAANASAETSKDGPASTSPKKTIEQATFGAGCFWHVEQAFEWLPGVRSAVSGYAGGTVRNPSYEMVHSGMTGHAEVVQVTYDPSLISYEKLLRVFWTHHDPTQLNRQGPDVGTQYRSVIFYNSPEQREAALKSYRELVAARSFRRPIVTQLVPLRAFYRAEQYHQNYYGGKPDHARAARHARSRAHRSRKPGPLASKKPPANAAAAPSSTSTSAPGPSHSASKPEH